MYDPGFEIRARWPHPPKPDERDAAEIGILVGRRFLTRVVDVETGEVRDFLRASAVSLAIWWADNWWRLRWEPIRDYRANSADWRLRHELTSAAGGTTWPPAMIYGVGDRVVVAPIYVGMNIGGPFEYPPIGVSILPGPLYEEGVDAFFREVVAGCVRARDGSPLKALVDQLDEERREPEIAGWRRLEARLGYDPDAAPDGLIETLSDQEQRIGADAIEEAAIGCPGPRAPAVLQEAIAASRASAIMVDLRVAAAVVQTGHVRHSMRATWMEAEDAAAQIRREIGRPHGPLHNNALSEIFDVDWSNVVDAAATASKLPYGARLRDQGSVERIALQTRAGRDRRFELARVLGDAVWSGNVQFGIISRGKTDRQKFQRAFAQSLLCPFSDIQNEVDLTGPTDGQIEAAARRFHVNRRVVRTLLVNKGFLPRETLEEKLDAA